MNFLTSEEFSTLLDEVDYSKLEIGKLLINFSDFIFSDHTSQLLLRIKEEFQDFFNENTIYIEFNIITGELERIFGDRNRSVFTVSISYDGTS